MISIADEQRSPLLTWHTPGADINLLELWHEDDQRHTASNASTRVLDDGDSVVEPTEDVVEDDVLRWLSQADISTLPRMVSGSETDSSTLAGVDECDMISVPATAARSHGSEEEDHESHDNESIAASDCSVKTIRARRRRGHNSQPVTRGALVESTKLIHTFTLRFANDPDEMPPREVRLLQSLGPDATVSIPAVDLCTFFIRKSNISREVGRFEPCTEKLLVRMATRKRLSKNQTCWTNTLTLAGVRRLSQRPLVVKHARYAHFIGWLHNQVIPRMEKAQQRVPETGVGFFC
jgi:hypothetical protein